MWKNNRKGRCRLCGAFGLVEAHHVLYRPERRIDLCHKCHFSVHYQPWLLKESQIKTLLIAKLYGPEFEAFIQNLDGQKEKVAKYAASLSLLAQARQPLPDIAPSRKEQAWTPPKTETRATIE
jgi:hypothetical protein